ncbi:hypothetical protein [Petroclostridium sp. X23]|uniref:hypothetical protein n=1 Tax=Petroclostridium sp. X23 TaxID=3045146 RepID=UPI0024AD192B|nr:hypothetical protein [Petroclostridium sp. X23]WHH57954.1 hypothetical protein QKW49_19400 [Petroclostridium sp. X23]
MATFQSFYGVITKIDDFWTGSEAPTGCYKLMSVQNKEGSIVNFVVTPNTYFVDHITMVVGDPVIGFYDANAPVPLIFPPQFRAIVMARMVPGWNVKVDYFNEQLISSDAMLKLSIAPFTQIILENDQAFTGSLGNRNLIVVYGAATKSIPSQATPYKIIIMCMYSDALR